MVAQNFEPALACVNVHEGGKDDDKRDPGGRTAYGVTQARYNQYLRDQGRPRADVWDITVRERVAIWRTYYWDVMRADELPAGLDYAVFDGGVNSGPAQAAKWLQRAVNDVRAKSGEGPILVDGQMGTNTLAAVNRIDDIDAVIAAMQDRRLAMLHNLKTWAVYGKGWSRRVNDVRKLAQSVARGSVVLAPPPGWTTAPGKALPSDAKPLPSATSGAVTSAVGTASSAVSSAATALQPAQGASKTLDTVLVVLLVLGGLLAAAGAAWAWWASRKAKRMAADLDIAPPPALANDNALVPAEMTA
ncbi:UNVERIFIED_ORG: lysozyme family protein [Xanthobacter viscosus]|uniref:N-acetylmuramidase n=1 Tax=Xanthobacter autotrophicus TaxID=280 RepID=A0A6C1KJM6_XANAU|nr:glycosyl hydrolase 108 family protein [Xanthobacter autotrophicus]TLX43837.1 N-acetylmuramidase [Xanthobacter autotrophicus]